MSDSSGVLMPDGSIRKHGIFPSHKVSDTEIVLDGLSYELVINGKDRVCEGCAFNYYGPYIETQECSDSEELTPCSGIFSIWKLKNDQ